MDTLFTIIIPSKNEENYIHNTLKSISKQTNTNVIKIIIADGGSTDNTILEIQRAIADFKNLDISIIQGGNVGYGRNVGASKATTQFLIFIDADTILLNEDIIYKTCIDLTNYELITTKHKSTTNNVLDVIIWTMFNIIRSLMKESFSTGCYFAIRRDKFKELGGFNESVSQSEDFLLSRQISKNNFKIINRYVGQDDRRFKRFGYLNFLKLIIVNYYHRNNINWFKKDVGYWL